MSASGVQLRRVAIALGISTAMVVMIAVLLPRAYLVNDDPGFVLYLRHGLYPPWISSVLCWALVAFYRVAPNVAWYGLYLYVLITVTGAVLIHTCIELLDHRPGFGRVAIWLGAIMCCASHIVLAIGVTWTTVSISALGTAMVAFVAHLLTCHATGAQASPLRAGIYGVLFVAGFALREAAIAAMAAALLPLLGWVAGRFVRSRYLPRPAALIAFVAPLAIVVATQGRMAQPRSVADDEFNEQRGRINDAAAFRDLDVRAPELLTRAGWTVDEYHDLSYWLLADDTEFSTEKVRRLADTGGVPESMGLAESYNVLRGIISNAPASVWLFLTAVAGGIALAWLGVVDRRRAWVFSLGYLVFLMVVPVAMSAVSRFPQRLSLSFYTVAAFGVLVFFAAEIASCPPRTESDRRGDLAMLVISVFVLAWGRNLVSWTKRDAWPYHNTLRAFADRVNAPHGIVMVAVGVTEMDPLLADPRGYDALPSGWGTFTALWYDYIEQFGIHSGSELLHKMVDNPNAYLVAQPYGHASFESWIRRRLHDPSIRMSLVDSAAGMPTALRSELYRLVTTPLEPGSDEWQLLARNQAIANDELPGSPDVSDRVFRSVALTAPYDRYALSFRGEAPVIMVEPVNGGIRYTVGQIANDPCTTLDQSSDRAGIHVAVNGLVAARVDLTLIEPENIVELGVIAQTETTRAVRWRWRLDDAARQFGFSGTVTLVPGYSAHRLVLVGNTARPQDIRDLRVWVEVKPGTHAGFELRRVEVAEYPKITESDGTEQ
jgi:hypothetical protein